MKYAFGNCQIDLPRRELRRGGVGVVVEPGVLDLLDYLLRNRHRVVSKDDLIAAVWDGRAVSDSTLAVRIHAVRSAIGDSGKDQKLIRTFARKGFRFVGDVREDAGEGQHRSGDNHRVCFPRPRLPAKPSIAVLAFANMSADTRRGHLCDGITEDIITALARRHVCVAARSASNGQETSAARIGRDLGVRYVLEGSVRKSRKRVRVTARLMDVATGSYVWADRYDRELSDVFALQAEIAANIAASIEPALTPTQYRRTAARGGQGPEAWDLVARALFHFWKLNARESGAAVAILEKAVQGHPDHGRAHSLLSFALLLSSFMGWSPYPSDRELAARLAHRAMELDDSDAWARLALAFLAFSGRQTSEAVYHFNHALDRDPKFPAAAAFMGFALAFDGQSHSAIGWFERALQMSPRDPFCGFFYGGLSAAQYMAGSYAEAVASAQEALRMQPGILGAHRCLCASLAQAGRIEEARVAMRTLRQLQPQITLAWIRRAVPYTAGPMRHFIEGMRKAGLAE